MIKVEFENKLQVRVLRELEQFVKNKGLKYDNKKCHNDNRIEIYKLGILSHSKYYAIINVNDIDNLDSSITIYAYGSASMCGTIAKLFDEYGYKNIVVKIISDKPLLN